MSIPKRRIAYFYDEDIGNYYYTHSHPMKPVRVRMTHSLVLGYKLHEHMDVFHPRRASPEEMMRFHTPGYIKFLQTATPSNTNPKSEDAVHYNIGFDCPVFDNIFEFCQISAGGSISAAQRLNYNLADVAINWAGGLHHARRDQASGFCYIADCVLGIMELLKYHPRVMYIDIDIHHGDGVEEAFYNTDRVLTVSFHKYGKEFFPESGHISDVGINSGKYYAVNVPLRDGMTDEAYHYLFKPIIRNLIHFYQPGAIFLQCGADSLVGDLLGYFNLSTYGHGECVKFVQSFGIPLLVAGGGGYIKQSVARCWTYETSLIVNQDIPDELPENDYLEYFQPSYKLHLHPDKKKNLNSEEFLHNIYVHVMENVRHLAAAPSVQMTELPPRAAMSRPIKVHEETSNFCKRLFMKFQTEDDIQEQKEQEEAQRMDDEEYAEKMSHEPNPNIPVKEPLPEM
ncbi:acetylpolyamine aminohydrolase, putative [Trichomonas vaginalis G3]|uniref:Histone deacetylase n=1 Tax=Trichomonas vaginalis (strain ATCC PRA-98 / G3) TaxID=412133 RepID=A2FDZ0_TRIV3|nr:histone deacetylase class I, eukaryotic type family [Trichomonas vaginalis G3]EAX96869.1 acetylpolyamine aminohydrolase, putative [Trichomonas vaginalis G3]KAI5534787.1 histone deacetylase class I, eukaryotic type family [Trichomonas vaginalis G3]|eukprot:XP_001309799.1 acetylpolyamine aminohydrolase [Trichomonas vaginalis G3]